MSPSLFFFIHVPRQISEINVWPVTVFSVSLSNVIKPVSYLRVESHGNGKIVTVYRLGCGMGRSRFSTLGG